MNHLASLTVVVVGAGWGLYWIPLRQLDAVAAAGPWATLIVVAVGALVLVPFGWAGRSRLASAKGRALASIALGGASFVLYSNGLLYGHVASVILLFYLTPIWSTLIARWWLHWPVSWWRYAAIATGIIGISMVLGGKNQGLPVPASTGDWLGLASGMLWAVASTGMHVHVRTRAAETNFVFCAGAAVMALLLAFMLAPQALPRIETADYLPALGWILILGAGWWAASLTAFMWATRELEPPRVGILLMSEVIVGTLSAALFANEPFGVMMTIGAMLVVGAGILETMPDRKEAPALEFRDDPELPPPPFPGSHMVIDDHYVFMSGLVAADVPGRGEAVVGDVTAETRFVLTELQRTLESVGCGMDRVVRADVHLVDLDEIDAMNKVYREFFDEGRCPARTCTESPRLFGGARVEITLLARRP